MFAGANARAMPDEAEAEPAKQPPHVVPPVFPHRLDACARPTCDKCDGPHQTDACPYFKGKVREEEAKAGEIKFDDEAQMFFFDCPHCSEICQVKRHEIACKIFRHATFKAKAGRFRFVNPHAPKAECDRWVAEGLIWGCGKPFRFDGKRVEVCDYI